MSYFDQYSNYAAQAAAQYNIPQNILLGLFQQESSWNPYAQASGSSAYGFGQLTNAAAAQVGANKFDPISNIFGSAAYLSQQYNRFGNWTDALAAYNQGHVNSAGLAYAASVMNKAKQFMGSIGDTINSIQSNPLVQIGETVATGGIIPPGLFSGNSCDMFCELKNWITGTSFFQRLALAFVAFIFIFGALIMYKPSIVTTVAKG